MNVSREWAAWSNSRIDTVVRLDRRVKPKALFYRVGGMARQRETVAENSIEVETLVREYKGGLRAVDGIDLRVDPGEIYGFLGPNGAGKSTTVLMLTTLLPPTSGSARVAGLDVVRQGSRVREVIGAALQEAALDPLLTGRDHVRLQAILQGIPRRERAARADELLSASGWWAPPTGRCGRTRVG